MQTEIRKQGICRGTDARSAETTGFGRLYASFSVLHNECRIRLYAKELCRQKEHLRIWLGVGDLCSVGNCIEKAAKPNALQDQRSILAGRTHGQFMTVRAQLQQCAAHIFVQIGWCHRLQIAAINRILLLCECLLLLRGVSVFLLTQDDVAIRNYIVLTQLVPDLQQMVDEKKISFNPAVELSYLDAKQQQDFLEAMDASQNAPSLSQAIRIKKLAQQNEFSYDAVYDIMNEEKKSELDTVTIKNETLRKYFPRNYTPRQMESIIIKLLDQWQLKKQQAKQKKQEEAR